MSKKHDDGIEAAERDMDDSIHRLEDERRHLEEDIAESRHELEEMRRVTGGRDARTPWNHEGRPREPEPDAPDG